MATRPPEPEIPPAEPTEPEEPMQPNPVISPGRGRHETRRYAANDP